MSSDRQPLQEVAIRVTNLHKCFQIYATPGQRLKQFVLPRLRRLLGMPLQNYYREFWALHDIDFEVRRGQTVGVASRTIIRTLMKQAWLRIVPALHSLHWGFALQSRLG